MFSMKLLPLRIKGKSTMVFAVWVRSMTREVFGKYMKRLSQFRMNRLILGSPIRSKERVPDFTEGEETKENVAMVGPGRASGKEHLLKVDARDSVAEIWSRGRRLPRPGRQGESLLISRRESK